METDLCEDCLKRNVCLVRGYITDAQERLGDIPYWNDIQINHDFVAKVTKCPWHKSIDKEINDV